MSSSRGASPRWRAWWRAYWWFVVILLLFVGMVAGLIVLIAKVLAEPRLADPDDRSQIRDAVTALLWFSLISGLAGMATIQTAKYLFGLRGWYQRRQVRKWLTAREGAASPAAEPAEDAAHSAWADLLQAMGVQHRARDVLELFDLPIEQLAAQISAASDVALRAPQEYERLLVALVGEHRRQDINKLKAETGAAAAPIRDGGAEPHGPAFDPLRRRRRGRPPEPRTEEPRGPEDRNRLLDRLDETRGAVAQQLQAGIDTLQVSVGQRWRRWIRTLALITTVAIAGLTLAQTTIHEEAKAAFVLAALLLGGFFSWMTRDLVAVVERLRSR